MTHEFRTVDNIIKDNQKRIATITKIIAALEMSQATPLPPKASSTTESESLLIGIGELAQILDIGESTLRNYMRQGKTPAPCGNSGKHQWERAEIQNWVKAGRPVRKEWAMMKGDRK